MKNWIVTLISMIFLVSLAGCGLPPAAQSILDTLAATSSYLDWTPTYTFTPSPTMTPLPTVTPAPSATPIPLTPTSNPQPVYCDNVYWPIVLGATWEFSGTATEPCGIVYGVECNPLPAQQTWQIIQIEGDYPYPVHFTVSGGGIEHYSCDETGIYWEFANSEVLLLPPENLIVPEQKIWEKDYQITYIGETEIITTPIGVFNSIPVSYSPGEGNVTFKFAPSIGLVGYNAGYMNSLNLTLVNHYISDVPELDAPTTCALAGITAPIISTNFYEGWTDEFDEYNGIYVYSHGGKVTFNFPGIHLSAAEGQLASINFQPFGGILAVKLVNREAYKIALTPFASNSNWFKQVRSGEISMVLEVDNLKEPNAGLYYQKPGDKSLTLLNTPWDMTEDEEYTIVFDLNSGWFSLYDNDDMPVIERDLSGFWGPEYYGNLSWGSFPWWTIGNGWTDTSFATDLLVEEVCYGRSRGN